MQRRRGDHVSRAKCAIAPALALALVLLLAACGQTTAAGAGGSAALVCGSTDMAPARAPSVAGLDPGGRYAFVYGDQIWVRLGAGQRPTQLTHLALPRCAARAWGPLQWSSDGRYIAFALAQGLTAGRPASSVGALYLVDTATGVVQPTEGTASVYGHAYDWYGPNALFYANGGGVTYYDLTYPGGPRPWEIVSASSAAALASSGALRFYSYGDLAFAGNVLYVTRIAVDTPGAAGPVGQAEVLRFVMPVSPEAYEGGRLAIATAATAVTNLGLAYAGAQGDLEAGAWQVTQMGRMVYQWVQAVDPRTGTVTAAACYAAAPGDGCDQRLFAPGGAQRTDGHASFAFAPGGAVVAMVGAGLYTQRVDGRQVTACATSAWSPPPVWSPDGTLVVATQLVGAAPDATGVVHYATDAVACAAGRLTVLAPGGQAWSWGP
jgi:hypothetical protein